VNEVLSWTTANLGAVTTVALFVLVLWLAPPWVIGTANWLVYPKRRPRHIRSKDALRKVYGSSSRIGKGTVRVLATTPVKVIEVSKD
jgi:hypothetical protein